MQTILYVVFINNHLLQPACMSGRLILLNPGTQTRWELNKQHCFVTKHKNHIDKPWLPTERLPHQLYAWSPSLYLYFSSSLVYL